MSVLGRAKAVGAADGKEGQRTIKGLATAMLFVQCRGKCSPCRRKDSVDVSGRE